MTQDAQKTDVLVPKAPENLAESDQALLKAQSEEIVKRLLANPDDTNLVSSVTNIGSKSQKALSSSSTIMSQQVGYMLKEMDSPEGSKVIKGLNDLRVTLEQYNPHKLVQPGFFEKYFNWLPGIDELDIDQALQKIASKYETIGKQLEEIMKVLDDGKDELEKGNLEIEALAKKVKQDLEQTLKNAYLSELIWENIERELGATSNIANRTKLNEILNDVAIRSRDLRMIEQADLQHLLGLGMTVTNNRRLIQSVDRTKEIARPVIEIGLFIQLELKKQKQVLGAVQMTQDFAAESLAQTAETINEQTKEISELRKNAVLNMSKVVEGFDNLMAALDQAEADAKEGTQAAKTDVAILKNMSSKIVERVLGPVQQEEIKAIEAGEEVPASA